MLADSRRFSTIAVGLCLITSPLLLLASALASPELGGDEANQLAVVARDSDRYYAFTLLIFVGSALFIPALIGLMSLGGRRAAAWGNLGGSLALIGAVIAVGDALGNLYIWQMAAVGADQAQMTALLTRVNEAPGAAAIFRIGGVSSVVGMLLLGVGLVRARAVPAWSAAGLGIGAFLNIAGFVSGSNMVVAASCAVLLVSLGWIGRLVLGSAGMESEALDGQGRTRPVPAVAERPA